MKVAGLLFLVFTSTSTGGASQQAAKLVWLVMAAEWETSDTLVVRVSSWVDVDDRLHTPTQGTEDGTVDVWSLLQMERIRGRRRVLRVELCLWTVAGDGDGDVDVDADEVKRKKRSTRRDHERLAQSATPDVRCPPGAREPPSMPPPACTSVHSAHTLGISLTQAQGLDRRPP